MSTITQQISQLPEYPSRTNPTSFNEKAEAWMAAEQAMTTQLNTFATQANALRASVNTLQSSATASASLAATAKTGADSAAALAISAAGATAYNAATVYTFGKSVIGSNGIAYRFVGTTGVAGDNPVTSATGNWKLAITGLQATIDQIAGLAPTLDLDFEHQVYRHYSPATGLREKALSDIVTFTRASSAQYWDAKGVMRLAGNNVPRIDFDPVTGVCRGLLIEESRTNNCLWSEGFSGAAWLKLGSPVPVVTANYGVAPDGTTTADLLTGATNTIPTASAINISQIVTISPSTTYTYSVYVRPVGGTSIGTRFRLVQSNVNTSGANTSDGNTLAIGGGWLRISETFTSGDSDTLGVFVIGNQDGPFLIWGAQLEAGSFPTSYIPTTTAAAARAADVAVISGTAFSDFYRQGVGTFLFSLAGIEGDSFYGALTAFSSASPTGDNYYINLATPQTTPRVRFFGSKANTQFAALSLSTPSCDGKIAAAFRSDNLYLTKGGGAVVDTTVETPIVDQLAIGTTGVFTATMCGCVNRLVYFPYRLPDATLQQLTAG